MSSSVSEAEFFGTMPAALQASFSIGPFDVHWGVVTSMQGKAIQPTLVAVQRSRRSPVTIGFTAPALRYLQDTVMNRPEVQAVNANQVLRLPENEDEFQELLRELKKAIPYESANIGTQIGEAGSNARSSATAPLSGFNEEADVA